MTVAEYQQAQKDIAEIRGQIAQLRDVVAKGVPAMRGVYGLDQPEAQPPIAEPQQTPEMMSAHEPVVNQNANVNPFQDNFTPSTNVKSMQEIAGQIAPQIDQPLGERLARGAMNLPVGMAAMAEQATSDPAGFAKGTAEYADTWMKRLNPNLMSPEAMIARQEFGQQLATDPVGTGLDALGVAGTALGLPGLGGKIKGFKSIKEARAAINDIGKPKVDVPEVVQEPIRSETPKVDLSSEKPQPTTAQEVVETAKPLINQEAVPAKIQETQAINLDNLLGGKISQQASIATKKRGASTYDGVKVGDIVVQNREGYTVKVDKLYENGKGEFTVIDAPDGHPWKNELNQGRTVRSSFHQPVTKNFTKLTPSDVPTTAEAVVKKAGGKKADIEFSYVGPDDANRNVKIYKSKFDDLPDSIKEQFKKQFERDGRLMGMDISDSHALMQNKKQFTVYEMNHGGDISHEVFADRTPEEFFRESWGRRKDELWQLKSGGKANKIWDDISNEKVESERVASEKQSRESEQRKSDNAITSSINDDISSRLGGLKGKKSKYNITHTDGKVAVDGTTYGDYLGIHKDAEKGTYVVDHIPSGLAVKSFDNLSTAKKFVAMVKDSDWNFKSKDKIPEQTSAAASSMIKFLQEGVLDSDIRNKYNPSANPTELSAGVNPFKIIDDYMTKRKLVNPLGTPEHVLSGKGIVEPFRKAQEAIRNDTKLRGESLQETLKGIQRGSKEDTDLYHRLDDPKAVLNEQEQAVRNYLDGMLTEVNKHREARGQEPVKRRKGYITHLVEEVEKQSREYGDTPMPKRFRFQFELAREGNASHKVSAIEALEVYTKAALKDIYIGDALAETVPKIEAMGDRPLIFKKSVTSPDGKVTNMSFYQFSDAPIVTERGYAESFIKGQMNVPTVGQRILDKVFDIKPNTSSHAAMAVTARFYQSLLGLAVDSSVKNLTQGINTMAEMGVLPTLKGYAKLATAKGLKTAKAEHLLEDFNPLLMEGADLPFKTKTARAIGKGFSATMNAPMKVAEFINRGAAYHAAYDVYIKKGMSLEQAHEAARAAVRKTQFSYAKIDTSPALRGPFARTFSQFFSYPLKQSEMMYKWATKPGEQGKLVRYFLYTGMAVVGAKYGGVDLSGVFFDPIRMVDPNSKEGFQLPGTDKRVTFDASKLGKSGYTPQGFAPSISIPADFIKSQMSDDESAREYGRTKALANVLPGGRYGKKVYDVITESDEKGKRDRLTRENTTKDKVLKLLGGKSTDREAESSRRETVNEVEKKYYATRQKLIDLKISGNEDEFIRLRDEFRDRYPFLYGRLMKGFGDAVKEERKKKGMTTDERFFDNSLRKQIDANL